MGSAHSTEKRTTDNVVRSRMRWGKENEAALMDLAYNARRAATLAGSR
ncbi:hypothetical protein [Methanomassiliicoccus luminyensis]|nr:hypothetical protein [Methanomassiliicoccus luminyensis]